MVGEPLGSLLRALVGLVVGAVVGLILETLVGLLVGALAGFQTTTIVSTSFFDDLGRCSISL